MTTATMHAADVDLAAEVYAAIASSTDGTFTRDGVQHARGYFVGGATVTLSGNRDVFHSDMIRAFVAMAPTPYIGVWTDADGTVYLDASQHFQSEAAALSIAAVRGEQSIWDIANAREIHVTTRPEKSLA